MTGNPAAETAAEAVNLGFTASRHMETMEKRSEAHEETGKVIEFYADAAEAYARRAEDTANAELEAGGLWTADRGDGADPPAVMEKNAVLAVECFAAPAAACAELAHAAAVEVKPAGRHEEWDDRIETGFTRAQAAADKAEVALENFIPQIAEIRAAAEYAAARGGAFQDIVQRAQKRVLANRAKPSYIAQVRTPESRTETRLQIMGKTEGTKVDGFRTTDVNTTCVYIECFDQQTVGTSVAALKRLRNAAEWARIEITEKTPITDPAKPGTVRRTYQGFIRRCRTTAEGFMFSIKECRRTTVEDFTPYTENIG